MKKITAMYLRKSSFSGEEDILLLYDIMLTVFKTFWENSIWNLHQNKNFLMKFFRALRTRTTPFYLKTNSIGTPKLKLTWILKTIFKQIQPKNAYHLKIIYLHKYLLCFWYDMVEEKANIQLRTASQKIF